MTKRDVQTWAELLQLMAGMILAAIDSLDDDDPIDFEAVKIRTSPEEALRRARAMAETEAAPDPDAAPSAT